MARCRARTTAARKQANGEGYLDQRQHDPFDPLRRVSLMLSKLRHPVLI